MSKNQIGKQPETTTGAAPVLTSGDTLSPFAERGTGSALRPQVPSIIGDGGEDMVEYTQSPVMGRVLAAAQRLASTTVTVRILGESGSGKTWLARLIHGWSGRKGECVVVDVGQLAPTLAESELFGHEKGAFTGAHQRKIGLFERAKGGTVFIDEIGDLPPDLQLKLLRVLEEGVVRRVGGTVEIPVDVRVICATWRDLDAMVAAGTFRTDLMSRLGVPVTMPPLRQRREDMPMILDGYALTDGARELLLSHPYDWPGNVRELTTLADTAAQAGLSADELRALLPTPRPAREVVTPAARRAAVLAAVARDGEVRTAQVAQMLGMRLDCASRFLARMVKDDLLASKGRGLFAPTLRQVCANSDSDTEVV